MAITYTAKGTYQSKSVGDPQTFFTSISANANDVLVVACVSESSPPNSLSWGSTTLNKDYDWVIGDFPGGGTAGARVTLYTNKITSGGTNDISGDFPFGGGVIFTAVCFTLSGCDVSGTLTWLNTSATKINDGTGTGIATQTNASAASGDLVFYWVAHEGPAGDTAGTGANDTSTTAQRTGTTGGGAASNQTISSYYGITSSSGLKTANFTGATSRDVQAAVVVFKQATSGNQTITSSPASSSWGVNSHVVQQTGIVRSNIGIVAADAPGGTSYTAFSSVTLPQDAVLVVAYSGYNNGTISTCTWNGISLTKEIDQSTGSVLLKNYVWVLYGATAGTGNIVINGAGTLSGEFVVSAQYLRNVSTFSSDLQKGAATGSSTTPSATTSSATTHAIGIALGFVATQGPPTDTAGTWGGDTATGENRTGTDSGGATSNATLSDAYGLLSSTGTKTASKSGITSRDWVASVLAFIEETGDRTITSSPASSSWSIGGVISPGVATITNAQAKSDWAINNHVTTLVIASAAAKADWAFLTQLIHRTTLNAQAKADWLFNTPVQHRTIPNAQALSTWYIGTPIVNSGGAPQTITSAQAYAQWLFNTFQANRTVNSAQAKSDWFFNTQLIHKTVQNAAAKSDWFFNPTLFHRTILNVQAKSDWGFNTTVFNRTILNEFASAAWGIPNHVTSVGSGDQTIIHAVAYALWQFNTAIVNRTINSAVASSLWGVNNHLVNRIVANVQAKADWAFNSSQPNRTVVNVQAKADWLFNTHLVNRTVNNAQAFSQWQIPAHVLNRIVAHVQAKSDWFINSTNRVNQSIISQQPFAIWTLPNHVIAGTVTTKYTLAELMALTVRMDVRRSTDNGVVSANSADVGGTTVNFNKTFKDIDSIVCTVNQTTARYVVVDFSDVPNPTSFKVLVFDSSGNRVSDTVYWVARGVV